MKKLTMLAATLSLGILFASPAMAGHYDHYHGHGHGHGYGYGHGHAVGYISGDFVGGFPAPHFPVPHVRSFFSISLGLPYFYAAAPVYVAPAPVYYPPPPVYYPPAPVVGAAVWIPGHYAYSGGARFYVEGHWGH